MDFNDYRLFLTPEVLPPGPARVMNQTHDENKPLDEEDAAVDLSANVDWVPVNLGGYEDEAIDTERLSPASTPTDDSDRMVKSLDLGHDSFDSDVGNYSFPLQSKSRTLEDSPHRSGPSPGKNGDRQKSSDGDNIKYKLMSAWNNMKFELKPKTTFRRDSPIWHLGICYHHTQADYDERNSASSSKVLNTGIENFKKDFISRIWFTYRKDFSPLFGSQLTTDVSWGCTLRTGQMLLAQGLVLHFLGRDWRWHSHQGKYDTVFHRQIIKFFGDLPSEDCPFSIHRLVQLGAESGKRPGDWYGPVSVAYVLREAVDHAPAINALLRQICLYVAQDCTIYKQDVLDLCTKHTQSRQDLTHGSSSSCQSAGVTASVDDPWKPVIILIPVRLGGETLNPIYIPCVRNILAHDNCIGIIGGRPKHSLYFVGWQEEKLIYLDPHLCQETVDVHERNFPLQTYHCMSPRKMAFTKMDPSCTLGFYCKTRKDFVKFVREAEQMAAPPKEKGLYPMFVFHEGRSLDLMANQQLPANKERYLRVRRLNKKGQTKGKPKEIDDFVFL